MPLNLGRPNLTVVTRTQPPAGLPTLSYDRCTTDNVLLMNAFLWEVQKWGCTVRAIHLSRSGVTLRGLEIPAQQVGALFVCNALTRLGMRLGVSMKPERVILNLSLAKTP